MHMIALFNRRRATFMYAFDVSMANPQGHQSTHIRTHTSTHMRTYTTHTCSHTQKWKCRAGLSHSRTGGTGSYL